MGGGHRGVGCPAILVSLQRPAGRVRWTRRSLRCHGGTAWWAPTRMLCGRMRTICCSLPSSRACWKQAASTTRWALWGEPPPHPPQPACFSSNSLSRLIFLGLIQRYLILLIQRPQSHPPHPTFFSSNTLVLLILILLIQHPSHHSEHPPSPPKSSFSSSSSNILVLLNVIQHLHLPQRHPMLFSPNTLIFFIFILLILFQPLHPSPSH